MFLKKLILGSLLLPLAAYAQEKAVVIRGAAPGAGGRPVRITAEADQISGFETVLWNGWTDSKGAFTGEFSRAHITLVNLCIGFSSTEFYAEPGREYTLVFDSVNALRPREGVNPFLDPAPLHCRIMNAGPDDLNTAISRFNEVYNDFILTRFNTYQMTRNQGLPDTLRKMTDTIPRPGNSNYYNEYVRYKLAGFEAMCRPGKRARIISGMLVNAPVLYHHTGYMDFFNSVFDQYLISGNRFISLHTLENAVNERQDYTALLDSVGKDTLLRNEVIREMVVLKGLKEMYNSPVFNRKAVLKILRDMESSTKFDEHREIAANLITQLTRLAKGTPAPDFSVISTVNKGISKQGLLGKYVYLTFWASWCEGCKAEMEAMQELYGKYHDSIEFVSISIDEEPLKMQYYLEKKGYGWIFAHSGNDMNLLDQYGVKAVPLFILIDRTGNIADYPAPSPSGRIEAEFRSLLAAEKNK